MRLNSDLNSHALLERLVPALEPPSGDLPDAERVAALAEGRLSPRQAHDLIEEIRRSPAARVELRALYPERFAVLLGEVRPATSARVLAFPVRRWVAAGAALAAAAAVVVLLPASLPSGSGAELQARSEAVRSGGTAEPGDRFYLMMRLGQPGLFDRLRGHSPWGALFLADGLGVRLVCTSADAHCRSGGDTLAWSFTAPVRAGVTGFAFVAAGQAPEPAALSAVLAEVSAEAPGPRELPAALERRAGTLRWRVHALDPVVVR